MNLAGKTIVLGVSGGIAAYKSAELVRQLVQAGATVRVVMTRHAAEFITPLTLQTLSGALVATSLFDLTQESEIGHIRLADTADAIVVAPATANVIGKAAAGLADDLLTTILLATQAPILLAPAMNVHMYENAIVQQNLAKLVGHGFRTIEPATGFLACGYEGQGRMAEPADIVDEVASAVSTGDLSGEKVLVTAGANREPIDPVRFLSNRSTGKMGYALARAAWVRGAEVVLVSGPTELAAPRGVRVIRATTAAEMLKTVRSEFRRATILLMAAAVADFRPAATSPQKLKKVRGGMILELERTEDVLSSLPARRGRRLVVGFAAETEDVVARAAQKLEEKGLDMIVANDVAGAETGFEVDTNAVTLLTGSEREDLPLAGKDRIADQILDRVVTLRRRRK